MKKLKVTSLGQAMLTRCPIDGTKKPDANVVKQNVSQSITFTSIDPFTESSPNECLQNIRMWPREGGKVEPLL